MFQMNLLIMKYILPSLESGQLLLVQTHQNHILQEKKIQEVSKIQSISLDMWFQLVSQPQDHQ